MERLDAEKIIYHADRLLDIKRTGDTYPIHIQIGLTEYCCHRCIFCYSEFATCDTTKNHTMNKNILLRFLREASKKGVKAVSLVGSGEPLLHPQIEEILYGMKALGLEIGIFTNGSRISESLRKAILETCTYIRFSVNAATAAEHEAVHRVKGEFDNIVNNIRLFVMNKKEKEVELPTIGTQFVFYEDNYRSMVEAARLWKKIGVDYFEIKPVIAGEGNAVNETVFPAKDTEEVKTKMLQAKQLENENFSVYTKYEQYQDSVGNMPRHYGKCYAQALHCDLWADGNLYLCGNQEQEKDIIGNICNSSFEEIWKGERRKAVIRKIKLSNCPNGCMGHYLNEFVWDYLYPKLDVHPNFI